MLCKYVTDVNKILGKTVSSRPQSETFQTPFRQEAPRSHGRFARHRIGNKSLLALKYVIQVCK
jgi:hypothetical protein